MLSAGLAAVLFPYESLPALPLSLPCLPKALWILVLRMRRNVYFLPSLAFKLCFAAFLFRLGSLP